VKKVAVGDIIDGRVENITDYGAFVELAPGVTGLVHISALSDSYVKRVQDVVRPGDRVKVEVLNIDERGRYKLRRIEEPERQPERDEEEREPEPQPPARRSPERQPEPQSQPQPRRSPERQPKPQPPTPFEDRW
jgi:predicted RNA-binding protein with RPS1 domain